MTEISKKDKHIDVFVTMVEQLPFLCETVLRLHRLICKYGLPSDNPNVDRDYIYAALIKYFERNEEFEKCADLVKSKNTTYPEFDFLNEALNTTQVLDMRSLGFKMPN